MQRWQPWNWMLHYSPARSGDPLRLGRLCCVVAGAGIWLPFVDTDLANAMGWNKSFVSSLFVALATSIVGAD